MPTRDSDVTRPTPVDFCDVRTLTEQLAAPLSPEDQTIQSMPDTSPTKWHRAHTSWFFETFLLDVELPGYRAYDDRYRYLFNSYYEAVGPRHARPERGLVSRPGAEEVGRYRQHVDGAMLDLLERPLAPALADLVTLGLHHEQQHQELLLMDIKHVLSVNPLQPAYAEAPAPPREGSGGRARAPGWVEHPGGTVEVGAAGDGFAFDNEHPRHPVLLQPFALAAAPVTCGDWQGFIDDGGYRRPELWLSDGWAAVTTEGWEAPLYWSGTSDDLTVFTLRGPRPVDPDEPVCHVSYYEADAYARWADARLPVEAEWEAIAADVPLAGRFLDIDALHPTPARPVDGVQQLFGDVWEWTASPYVAYPGFHPAAGAVGEYNGKFMVNQQVLRGGSCLTPAGHVRPTYRNFFPPGARWPMTGVRLARDLRG
jgi:ergothioneine biosynthesis protein EgtB